MTRRERLEAGYSEVLDCLARWVSRVDTLEAYVEQNRELLSDEKINATLDSIAAQRAEIAQERSKVEHQARIFGLID